MVRDDLLDVLAVIMFLYFADYLVHEVLERGGEFFLFVGVEYIRYGRIIVHGSLIFQPY